MTNESILISEVIPATPQRIFSAWMDSAQHSAFTGDEATLVNEVGGELRAAGGYIQGRTLELNEGSRIVQSWRTTEFPPESPDSRVEITLEPTLGGTLVTLLHTDIPVGQGDRYRQGWNEYYLSRMKAYFSDGDQTSSDRAGMRGKIHDADADIDDDTDDAVLDLDGDDGDDTQLEVSIVEADVITSVGERPAGDGQPRARTAPSRANGATKFKAAPKSAAKPAAKPAARSAARSAERPAAKPIKLAAKSAKAPVKKAKAAVSASARKAAKKAPKAAARRPAKKAGEVKVASARRAAKPGKAKVVAKARVKAKAKSKPKAVKARSKPAKGQAKDRKAKVAKGRAKGPTSARARR